MSREFFEQIVDAVVGLVPVELGSPSTRLSSINVKVWFGDPEGREHYEAQLLRDGKIEIGFHAEHRSAEMNEAVLARLIEAEPRWRPELGADAVAGEFLGADGGPWRRLSEVTPVPRPFDVEAALYVAERLADFVEALEPVRATDASRENDGTRRV